MATNQIQRIRDNRDDVTKELAAYDDYVKSMQRAGQKPKSLKDLR